MSVLLLLFIHLLIFVSRGEGQEEPEPLNPLFDNYTSGTTSAFHDELLDRLYNASELVAVEDVHDFLQKIESIFGHPEEGVINSSSYFGVLSRAYFANAPYMTPAVDQNKAYATNDHDENKENLRYTIIANLNDFRKLEKFIEECNQSYYEATEDTVSKELLERLNNCVEDETINTLVALGLDEEDENGYTFADKFLKAAIFSTNILLQCMLATVNIGVVFADEPIYKPTLFLILDETTKLDEQMEANLVAVKKLPRETKLNNYVKTLTSRLDINNKDKEIDGYKDSLSRVVKRNNKSIFTLRNNTLLEMQKILNDVSSDEWVCLISKYRETTDGTAEEYYTTCAEDLNKTISLDYDVAKAFLNKYYNQTREVYHKYYHVEQNEAYTWNFTVDNPNADELNIIHGMRLAWELLDIINEDLLVFLNRTYFSYRRDASLQDAQRRYKANKKLFNRISFTYGRFCERTYNETGNYDDLIGTCEVENNEICTERTVEPTEWPIPPKDDSIAGLSPLKPKRIKVLNPLTREFETKLVHVIKYKTCRCGFRLDCGDEFGEKIYCVLQPNDEDYRKQCRGTQGYPCKTLPLAPNRHHESCITGYCDMEGDSCEDAPPVRYMELTSRAGQVKNDKTAMYAGITALIIFIWDFEL